MHMNVFGNVLCGARKLMGKRERNELARKDFVVQRALGLKHALCMNCKDTGFCTNDDSVYFSDRVLQTPCGLCEKGYSKEREQFRKQLSAGALSTIGPFHRCGRHPHYEGGRRPTSACEMCWKIYFIAPTRPKTLIDNSGV